MERYISSIPRPKLKNIDTVDNWYTKGHTNSSIIMSSYITSLPRPNGNISDKEANNNWLTKGQTDSFYSRSGSDKKELCYI